MKKLIVGIALFLTTQCSFAFDRGDTLILMFINNTKQDLTLTEATDTRNKPLFYSTFTFFTQSRDKANTIPPKGAALIIGEARVHDLEVYIHFTDSLQQDNVLFIHDRLQFHGGSASIQMSGNPKFESTSKLQQNNDGNPKSLKVISAEVTVTDKAPPTFSPG